MRDDLRIEGVQARKTRSLRFQPPLTAAMQLKHGALADSSSVSSLVSDVMEPNGDAVEAVELQCCGAIEPFSWDRVIEITVPDPASIQRYACGVGSNVFERAFAN